MIGVVVSVVHLLVTLNAIIRSLTSRFWAGGVAGVVRAGLLAVGIMVGFRLGHPGRDGSPPGPALVALVVGVVGPVVAVGTLIVALMRTRNVPAQDAEKFEEPVVAWLPVAMLDIVLVVIAALALAISNPL